MIAEDCIVCHWLDAETLVVVACEAVLEDSLRLTCGFKGLWLLFALALLILLVRRGSSRNPPQQ